MTLYVPLFHSELLGIWDLLKVWNSKYQHLLEFLYLEFQMIGKVKKLSNIECYTPLSESLRFYLFHAPPISIIHMNRHVTILKNCMPTEF
jgi:hypothetical protein